jgi:lactate dehydrogenase-like 2-hydroxyacid dehydrogenase
MSKPNILVMGPMYQPKLDELEASYTCHRVWTADDPAGLIARLAPECEIVVTNGGRGLTADEMKQLPRLKLVACFGVGVDAIDLAHAKANGIAVTNTPDVLTEDVADMALALLLGTVRRIPQGDRFVREGRWLKGGMGVTMSLQRKRVGVVGLGRIGRAIAKRCAAFNTDIGYFGPNPKSGVDYAYFNDIVALAQWADVLIAACPGGPATYRIVSRAALQALGPDGVFVNIARGSVVDQAAMIELLASGALGSAGLDVFDDEPRVPAELIALQNVVLHPHQASATHPTRTAMGQLVLDNVAAFVAGRALVTPV